MKTSLQTLLLGAGFGTAFLLGQWCAALPAGSAAATAGPAIGGGGVLAAQGVGRGPVNPPPSSEPETGAPSTAEDPVVFPIDGGQSAAGNGFLAVTGSYGVGTSVLYLVDTQSRQLAVYEARGGSAEQRRIVLVGARRIDLDLQLRGYNDRSEYEYEDLEKLFDKRDKKDRSVRTGLERDK